jgi:hypothetical protein
LPFRSGANQLFHDLAVLEEENRRNAHDLIATGNFRIFIGP